MKDNVVYVGWSQESEQASIERLTESFIAGLQVDFPSTTSTVFRCAGRDTDTQNSMILLVHYRTGDKLTVGGDKDSKRCTLCQVRLHR